MTIREITQLRPRSMGELLDQAIRLYRENFITYLGIIGMVQVPISLLSLLLSFLTIESTASQFTGEYTDVNPAPILAASVGAFVVSIASFILVSGLGTAALTRAIADNYLGEETGILLAYKKIKNAWGPLIGTLFFVSLVTMGILIWTIVPVVGWLTGPGILIFQVMVVTSLIAPCVVLEERKTGEAFSRAWSLGLKRFWWLIGYLTILSALSYLIVYAPTSLVSYFMQSRVQDSLMAGDTSVYMLQTIFQSLLTLVLSLIYIPLQFTGVILVYFDLRVRFEGFDLSVLAHQAETEEVQVENLTSFPLGTEQKENFLTGKNIGRFIGLTMAGVLAFIILMSIGMVSALPFL
ncbi:MAG: hypothetical protein ABFS17_10510 [Chloroflexota bacterium]